MSQETDWCKTQIKVIMKEPYDGAINASLLIGGLLWRF